LLRRQVAIRPGSFRLRLEHRIVHLHQRRAGGDRLPFPEQDRRNPPLFVGAQFDGLDRLDTSCGAHGVDD
jgi:hypothetical protein